jgi:hypothetical protein
MFKEFLKEPYSGEQLTIKQNLRKFWLGLVIKKRLLFKLLSGENIFGTTKMQGLLYIIKFPSWNYMLCEREMTIKHWHCVADNHCQDDTILGCHCSHCKEHQPK